MSKIFVDTNLLVYALDQDQQDKRDRSRELLGSLQEDRVGVLSTQVLQETYVVATTKLGVAPLDAKQVLQSLTGLELVTVTQAIIYDAIDCSILNRLSFWDGLILAAAASAKCDTLWSEDLNAGQTVRGVRVENPLA